jgi:anti-anti-sigma regulatory factor
MVRELHYGCHAKPDMLNIQRSSEYRVVLSLSGRIETQDVAELQRILSLEVGQPIALDLREVTMIDRDAVKFLAHCELQKIKLENCPAYIRKWIDADTVRSME